MLNYSCPTTALPSIMPGPKYFFFLNRGIFLIFFYSSQHCFIFRPLNSTVSEDARIQPRTVATSALAVRRSIHKKERKEDCLFSQQQHI